MYMVIIYTPGWWQMYIILSDRSQMHYYDN